MGRQIPQAHGLGRGQHRGDLDLLPSAAGAPQAHEVDQHAGAPQRGDQTAHLRGANLPQRRELPKAGAGADRRAPRGLARGPSLSEHGSLEGAQEGDAASGGLTMLRPTKGMDATPLRRRRSPALRLGRASDGGSEGMAWPDPMINFAELDA